MAVAVAEVHGVRCLSRAGFEHCRSGTSRSRTGPSGPGASDDHYRICRATGRTASESRRWGRQQNSELAFLRVVGQWSERSPKPLEYCRCRPGVGNRDGDARTTSCGDRCGSGDAGSGRGSRAPAHRSVDDGRARRTRPAAARRRKLGQKSRAAVKSEPPHCTYYNEPSPRALAPKEALQTASAPSYSAVCLMIQSRLTEPRFARADRRDLNAAATIETTTAPETIQSASMPGSPSSSASMPLRVARACHANRGPDELYGAEMIAGTK
jgi:hypothetical protein